MLPRKHPLLAMRIIYRRQHRIDAHPSRRMGLGMGLCRLCGCRRMSVSASIWIPQFGVAMRGTGVQIGISKDSAKQK